MNKITIAIIIIVIAVGILAASTLMQPRQSQKQPMKPGAASENTNSSALTNTAGREVNAEDVTYFETTNGYFARPKAEGAYPGVVMIHEWWGLNDNIKDMARILASEGYLVLAVDLFGGAVATTPDEAMKQIGTLDKDVALNNLRSAADYLRSQKATRVASLGWCFGGGQSLALALSGEQLDATVIYYGTPLVTDATKLAAIDWPVLGIFGDKDTSIPVATVEAFQKSLNDTGIQNSITMYPGVGHAFANPSGQNYAPNETKDAWTKTLAFLKTNLASK